MKREADFWIENLNLEKLEPEGGYFRQVYFSRTNLSQDTLGPNYSGDRPLVTSIFYLLRSGQVSRFHRLQSDEIWAFHHGSGLILHQIEQKGNYAEIRLGVYPEKKEAPQFVVKAGTIFGATVIDPDSYSLVGCMVSPGFSFDDFELISREYLLEHYQEYEKIIYQLT